jgi:hypothetical protein
MRAKEGEIAGTECLTLRERISGWADRSSHTCDTAAEIIFGERIQFDYTLTCMMNGRVYYIVRSHDISRRDNRRDEVGPQLASPYSPRAIFYLLLCASFRFLSFKCSMERVQESLSRQDAKSAKKCLSIYPNLARASRLRGNHLFSDLYL